MRTRSELACRLAMDGTIEEASRGLEHVLGAVPGSLNGRLFADLLAPGQGALLEAELARLRASKPAGWLDLDLVDAAGRGTSARWAWCWDSEQATYLGSVPDRSVTLPHQTDLLRLLLDHLEEGVIVVGQSGLPELVNRAAAQLVGLKLLSVNSSDWPSEYGLFAGESGPRLPLELWPVFRALGGEPVAGDELYYRTPVREGWMQIRASPMGDGALLVLRDVTQQRESMRDLVEQATLLDEAQDAITVRCVNDRVRYWSRGAERLYGWTPEQAKDQPVADLLQADEEVYRGAMGELLAEGAWSGELTLVTASGQCVQVEARWTLMRDPDGTPRGILGIETDISGKRQLEAQFLRAQRMESLGTLAGGIAHELNNVLAPILMAVDLLAGQTLDEEGRELVSLVATSARRGADLVKQVLTFARGVGGTPQPLQPGFLVNEVARMARDTFPKNVRVEAETAPGLPAVLADPTQIHQVLLNLALNSRDAMPRGGLLTLRAYQVQVDESLASQQPLARPGSYVVLAVADTGHGMDADVRERIFEPFFTTKPHGEGTGLGLSTALAIVKSHGGFLTVDSEPGQGTTFKLYLRACQSPPPDGQEPVVTPRGRGELVVVVDDEDPIRLLTGQLLQSHGYRVLSAADGAETVALYAQHRQEVNLVLLDMQMPLMDGYTTIMVLQRLEPSPVIVAASGFPSQEDILRANSLGVRYFLAKPYSAEVLLQTVREALDQAPSRIPSGG